METKVPLIIILLSYIFINISINEIVRNTNDYDLILITVATDTKNEGYRRLVHFCNQLNHILLTFGDKIEWRGGNIITSPGGGQKLNLLKNNLYSELMKFKNENDLKTTILLFLDGYDTIVLGTKEEILDKFFTFTQDLLISAEDYIWPDKSLEDRFESGPNTYRFPNSGLYMGFYGSIMDLLNYKEINDSDDDQLYIQKYFLENESSKKMRIDHSALIFQNNLDQEENFIIETLSLINKRTQNRPLVLHGNGVNKVFFNRLCDHFEYGWVTTYIEHPTNDQTITVVAWLNEYVPFLNDWLKLLTALKYEKSKMIILFCSNKENNPYHHLLDSFMKTQKNTYMEIKIFDDFNQPNECFLSSVNYAKYVKTAFFLWIDGNARVTEPYTLLDLILTGRNIVAPLLKRIGSFFANTWTSVKNRYYNRGFDYFDLLENKLKGIHNVPYVGQFILFRMDAIDQLIDITFFKNMEFDFNIQLATLCRNEGLFMHSLTFKNYGYLMNDTYIPDLKVIHLNLYQGMSNQYVFDQYYIHHEYFLYKNGTKAPEQPCPDVFRYPLFSELFAQHLIELMNHFNLWSGAAFNDKRLAGGYENVPTDDIHFTQVGLQDWFIFAMKEYLFPISSELFPYYHAKPLCDLVFVVRYSPDRMAKLRIHDDASSLTYNIALNRQGIDFEGGGARFIRYNCSVIDSKVGWTLVHPGRITHSHEGLQTISGTRYILVAFTDP